MTPEEKKAAADAASAEAAAAEEAAKAEKEKADADFEEGLDGLSDEEKEAKRAERDAVDTHKIDYDLEIKAEKERADKAEKALADRRFKDAEARRKAAEAAGKDPDNEDDKPVTRKELDAVKAEAKREAQEDRALEIAGKLAGSEKEAELIVAKWRNRTFPADMALTEQLEEMHAVVHRKKLIGDRDEALRALKGKESAIRSGASAHRDPAAGKAPKLAPQDEQAIRAAGFEWNGIARRFEKKLGNGSTLVREAKSGRTFIVPAKKK